MTRGAKSLTATAKVLVRAVKELVAGGQSGHRPPPLDGGGGWPYRRALGT